MDGSGSPGTGAAGNATQAGRGPAQHQRASEPALETSPAETTSQVSVDGTCEAGLNLEEAPASGTNASAAGEPVVAESDGGTQVPPPPPPAVAGAVETAPADAEVVEPKASQKLSVDSLTNFALGKDGASLWGGGGGCLSGWLAEKGASE